MSADHFDPPYALIDEPRWPDPQADNPGHDLREMLIERRYPQAKVIEAAALAELARRARNAADDQDLANVCTPFVEWCRDQFGGITATPRNVGADVLTELWACNQRHTNSELWRGQLELSTLEIQGE